MRKIKKSKKLFERAKKCLVGGVNSPVRAFKSVGGNPVFIERGKGAHLWDADGNRYIDFLGSWGPMILGHANHEIVAAVQKRITKGFSYGAPTELEAELAEMVCRAMPSIEKARFVSSGTEAVMTAIRLARAYTGRDKIVKFSGCYHGHSDGLLVKAGSGATTLGIPDSAGVPDSISHHTIVLPYNSLESVERCFNRFGEEIAAIIVEPVAGNMGLVLPETGFLAGLRKISSHWHSLLIFDEVITGFRLAYGGAQKIFKVRPDITCLGKIIGGGFPVGAIGGRKEVMDRLAPAGDVYQAGTLSGNPVAVSAGSATLTLLRKIRPYLLLQRRTEKLLHFLWFHSQQLALPVQINHIGSMFTIFFAKQPVTDYDSARRSDTKLFAKFFHHLLEEGIYFPPSQFETAFVSLAHSDSMLDEAGHAIVRALRKTGNRYRRRSTLVL